MSKAQLPDYFDSMTQAAVLLGVPLDELKHAKNSGCTAFRSGRVYRKEIVAWLIAHPPQEFPERGGNSENPVTCGREWERRNDHFFDVMETLLAGHISGALSAQEFVEKGKAALDAIAALQVIFQSDRDPQGFREIWEDIFEEALKGRWS